MTHNVVRLFVPVLLGALILLFPAQGLRALGLGEARVDSWLGQTLDVSIRLLDIESAAIESISVGPASLTDYERLGLPSESLALGLEVIVDRRVDPPRIRVRSQQPVNDPVVQILIDARWASGRVLREYTLFLDPPTVESAAPARRTSEPVSAPASAPSEPAPATERATESAPQRPARPATPAPRQPAESQSESEPDSESATEPRQAVSSPPPASARPADAVQVSQGDTLWSIAQAWRPEQSLSMDQVMLAIFNRNRNAFLEGNINRMRSDVRLDMPGLDEVRALDRAAAEQRIREHMRSWQPAADPAVPVVSDAAMPERTVPDPVDAAADRAPAGEEHTAAPVADQTGERVVHRLDVVPPEDELFSDGSAVAEEEIDRVSDSLAEVEREIVEQGFDDTALDEHVQEVREALAQRDIAGLAVAQESLAELQERLREARLARAELEEPIAQGDAGDEGDAVADYLRGLEDEFNVAEAGDDPDLIGASGDGQAGDSGFGVDESAAEVIDEPGSVEVADEVAPQPMTVTRTDSGGLSAWLWPLIGLLILVILIVWALRWLRGRSAGQTGSELAGGENALDAARSAIARDPEDLGARLALLRLLADHGDEQEFIDAFDQMYQEVDDETAPQWQDALSLAAIHAPDHPLLQPNETGYGADADFDRRADEMLGMLDVDEGQDELDTATDEAAPFDPLGEPEPQADDESASDLDTDTDLAVLASRLDDPSSEPIGDTGLADDDETSDTSFDEFQEAEELASGLAEDDEEEDDGDGLALESSPLNLAEDEDVFGTVESGHSETTEPEPPLEESGDAGLDFSSELSSADQDSLADEFDFLPGDASDPIDESLPAEFADTDSAGSDAAAVLNDEDADVKLDLARAYISVDLSDSARAVLEEVLNDGSQAKRSEAQQLLDELG